MRKGVSRASTSGGSGQGFFEALSMEYTDTAPSTSGRLPPALQSDWWKTIPAFLNLSSTTERTSSRSPKIAGSDTS